jgi:putative transposase
MKYAFIRAHQTEFGVRAMCRVLRVHFSGFYAWLKEPLSRRAQEDLRQMALIRQAWSDSGKVYGYRKLTDDLRDLGEQVSENRVARLASLAGILAQVGYKRRPGRYGGKPAVVASNSLDRQFEVDAPDKVWGEPLKAPLVRAQWRATSPTSRPTKAGCICLWSSTCSRGV